MSLAPFVPKMAEYERKLYLGAQKNSIARFVIEFFLASSSPSNSCPPRTARIEGIGVSARPSIDIRQWTLDLRLSCTQFVIIVIIAAPQTNCASGKPRGRTGKSGQQVANWNSAGRVRSVEQAKKEAKKEEEEVSCLANWKCDS